MKVNSIKERLRKYCQGHLGNFLAIKNTQGIKLRSCYIDGICACFILLRGTTGLDRGYHKKELGAFETEDLTLGNSFQCRAKQKPLLHIFKKEK